MVFEIVMKGMKSQIMDKCSIFLMIYSMITNTLFISTTFSWVGGEAIKKNYRVKYFTDLNIPRFIPASNSQENIKRNKMSE